jgi:probable DNA repair protein
MLSNTKNTVICMTENQVEDIRLIFKDMHQKKTIQLPGIYSLNRWLKKEYQEFSMTDQIGEINNIMNGIEERLLWEKIIKNDLKNQSFLKTEIDGITNKVISADSLIRDNLISKDELKKNEASTEMNDFNQWRNQFDNYCIENKLLSRSSFIELFIKKQKVFNIIDNQKLLLVGFDDNSLLYENLINTLKERNEIKNYTIQEEKIIQRQKLECENVEDEIKEVIKWIKGNSKKKLLIISPALSRVQIKLQNEIDREIQPNIYSEYNKNSIYNSNLKRPLSNEPIITASISLLKLNNTQSIKPKLIYESLLFNNWIDSEGYKYREQLGNYIKDKKLPKISINSLKKLIDNDSKMKELKLDSLKKTLLLIEKNQALWSKKKELNEWIILTEGYWVEIKLNKINNLLPFEINNINSLFNSLNQLKNNKIINYPVTFQEYWEILFTQLENSPAPKSANDFYIDINGFAENPIKKYDAIWLMNMNTNLWPGKTEFNPFIPKKLQKKYHIFDEIHIRKIDKVRLNRLNSFGPDITISYSNKDVDTLLIATPGYFDELKAKKIIPKVKEIDNKKYLEKINDHKAPEILGTNINVSGGFRCLENFHICPAWSFYENRLHAKTYQEDDQEEISKMSRGNLIHELLEKFWKEHKSSINLAKMSEKALLKSIEILIHEVMSSYQVSKPHISPSQIKLEGDYFKNLLYQWLCYEKLERPRFSVIESEEKYPIKIDRINFNVKIDRIDQYEDGSRLLIDYKTGSEAPISQWKKSPVTSLQMPIYIVFTGIENISAAGIGYVHNNDVKLVGLSSYTQEPIDGMITVFSKEKLKTHEDQWSDLIASWGEDIHKLASGYLSGDAKVTYGKEDELKYCSVKPLLRLAERKWQFENPDE